MDIEEFTFTYEVLEIRADDKSGKNGALVLYTPKDEMPAACTAVEKFVPVPFHKARDKEHAIELMQRKIESYAPRREWLRDCVPDESGDTETIGSELAAQLGVKNADSTGDTRRNHVPESGGSERLGSGSDGDNQNETAPDGAATEGRAEPGAG